MKKNYLLSVTFSLLACTAMAQIPQGINYQGIAREASGTPVDSRSIGIRISVVKDNPTGSVEYAERHQVTTNQFGLFTLVIGQGTVITGNFPFISWALGTKWLQIDMDLQGGTNFQPVGSQQLMSVPFAFYAQYSGNGYAAGPGISISNNTISNTGDTDNSITNEIQDLSLTGNNLKITGNAGAATINLAPYLDNTDNQNLSLAGNTLSLTNDATPVDLSTFKQDLTLSSNLLSLTSSAVNVNLAPYLDNTDAQSLSLNSVGTNRTINISGGTGIALDVADNDNSITNEIQDLTLGSNILKITNNGSATNIDLTPYLDNTDSQNLSLSTGGITRTINISGGAGVVFDVADNDNSPSNEIQDLTSSVSGTQRTINISGGGLSTTIDVADNDNSITNEIQDLTLASNILKITNNASPTSIDLAPYLDNTDNQDLSLSGNTLSLTNDGTSVNLAGFLDNTDNQDLALSGNTLSLTNDGTTVDLAGYLDNTDGQNLSLSTSGTNRTIGISGGTGVIIDVADNDNSITNEIQDLSLTSNTLKITNNASASNIDLAPYLDNTDNQDLSLTGNTLSLTNDGTTVDLAGYLDNTDNQDLSLAGNTLSLTNDGTTVNLAGYLDNTDSQNLIYTASTNNLAISGGNNVTITHTLAQVLNTGNDAGGLRIQNVGSAISATDVVTKSYVDTGDKIYAFKVRPTFSAATSGTNIILNLPTPDFDTDGVLSATKFTATVAGVYVFHVTATSDYNVDLTIRVNGTPESVLRQTGFPNGATKNYVGTFMHQLSSGATVELVLPTTTTGDAISVTFSGHKL